MSNYSITEDTKAVLLLCGIFGNERSLKPLTLSEYTALVQWLIRSGLRPRDLLLQNIDINEASQETSIEGKRLIALLSRGVQLGFALEEWQQAGIWVMSRSDEIYPQHYKKHLKDKAPALLYGIGNRKLLNAGGLAIVGSRNINIEGEGFTRNIAELCAHNRIPVISGGARGVDQIAMMSSLQAGGASIGVLAENLMKKSLERSIREALSTGRMLLLSPYHPKARFSVGGAMGRNKLIYALADYGLVADAEYKKGGTWNGAEEELRRIRAIPLFVRSEGDIANGNIKLLDFGAVPWPKVSKEDDLHQILLENGKQKIKKESGLPLFEPISTSSDKKEEEKAMDIYQAVVPFILNQLSTPMDADMLAKKLDVNKTQLSAWLKRAVSEGIVEKLSKPVRYQKK